MTWSILICLLRGEQDSEGWGARLEGQREDISTHRKKSPKQNWNHTGNCFCFRDNLQMAGKKKTWVEDCLEMEQPDKRIYFFIPTFSLFPHLSTMGERRHSRMVKSLLCSKGCWPPFCCQETSRRDSSAWVLTSLQSPEKIMGWCRYLQLKRSEQHSPEPCEEASSAPAAD